MNKNPFTLMYGIPSNSVISRDESLNTILNSFLFSDSMYMYLIIGIRGSGKTVLLRDVYNKLSNQDNWLTVDLNPQGEIIQSLSNKLSASSPKSLLDGWSISINLPHISIKKKDKEINNPEIISEKIIEKLSSDNKKVLITIDEVNNTKDFQKFANFYQSLIGKGLKVYLLLTGLKENINSIVNDKAMTFLTRAPKIELEPLSLPAITLEYQNVFDISKDEATKMAKLTNGYAFAYQVLGYMFYESKNRVLDKDFIQKYDQYLWSNRYNKFWTDLTDVERNFLKSLANSKSGSKEEMINSKLIKESNYSQYRKRLIEKGLIYQPKYDCLDFVLPRFREFISYAKDF